MKNDKITLVVIANGEAYNLCYEAHGNNISKVKFVNEQNFNDVVGCHVNIIIVVGEVKSENLDKFKTLIKG